MGLIREPMENSLVANTTMNRMISNGIHNGYEIQAIDGYVLHDKRVDYENMDGDTVLSYKTGSTTVGVDYDFENVVAGVDCGVSVLKVGMFEFYAIPIALIPDADNQILDNDIKAEVT